MIRRVLLFLAAAIAMAAAAVFGATALFHRPGPLPAAREVVVPHGGTARVAAALAAERVVADPTLFRIAALATRGAGPIHAAEFAFPPHASLADVLRILRTARPVQHELTIPEGLTAAEIARLLVRAEPLRGPLDVPREGGVLPQTYAYERGEKRQTLARRMEAAMATTLDEVWRTRDPGLGLRDPHELLVLASIVERETGLPAERPLVARVFLNRLRAGMRLQSDPTAAYAANGGDGSLDRRLTRGDLAFPNPYNTYEVTGLPPAPICSPGLASLRAVAHPAAGDALFFVADGSGGHVFAADLATHLRNVARYRAAVGRASGAD